MGIMCFRFILSALILAVSLHGMGQDAPCITNCHDLAEIFRLQTKIVAPVELTARVTVPPGAYLESVVLEDASGGVILQARDLPPDTPIRQDDKVRLVGNIRFSDKYIVNFTSLTVLSHEAAQPPPDVTPEEILAGRADCRYVRLRGTITDVFRDEIDPRFLVLAVKASDETIYAFLRDNGVESPLYRSWPRSTVLLSGIVDPDNQRYALRHLGRTIGIPSVDHVTVLKTGGDVFPDISRLRSSAPSEIARADRHQVTGNVLAAWKDGLLLRTADGAPCVITLATDVLPPIGRTIRAVGFPTTDLYHVNLTRATWQTAAPLALPADEPIPVSAAEISHDAHGNVCFKPWLHGKVLRLQGRVRPAGASRPDCILLEDGVQTTPIDASACPEVLYGVDSGASAEVTGVCILSVDAWRQNAAFPQINGYRLVVRGPDDIRVLARPPWWTARRLTLAIYGLLTVLLGILAILLVLRHLLAKRSRELEAEIGAHIESECLVQERTRLAVELHDSITQNLTGASLELRAAARSAKDGTDDLQQHLDLALKTVDSSLGDLRNCIWDLRNRALEESDFASAIRLTLLPHVDTIDLLLRFNVPREILSDNAAHVILCVIRELTLNAVRHGHATQVKVAGAIEGGKLLFSVRDNGAGFDPSIRPSVRQGHFGLQGITERLKAFGGTLAIDSRPGSGTRVSVSINLPQELAS